MASYDDAWTAADLRSAIEYLKARYLLRNTKFTQVVVELSAPDTSRILQNFGGKLPSQLAKAVHKRKAEYLISRICAGNLLLDLGSSLFEVGTGTNREPLWPPGYVGSISHTKYLLSVAVARESAIASIGIDFEVLADDAQVKDIVSMCVLPEERDWLGINGSLQGCSMESGMATLIFSAKESFFKTLYPKAKMYFDFSDAAVDNIDLRNGCLRIILKRSLNRYFFKGFSLVGEFEFKDGHVFTQFELPAEIEWGMAALSNR